MPVQFVGASESIEVLGPASLRRDSRFKLASYRRKQSWGPVELATAGFCRYDHRMVRIALKYSLIVTAGAIFLIPVSDLIWRLTEIVGLTAAAGLWYLSTTD